MTTTTGELIKILGIPGSLRHGSYNRALLRAAAELAPEAMAIDMVEIGDIPPYNGDVEAQGFPESVQHLKDGIAEADALLIATPEYNYGIPGVLKNAIDWASRPPRTTPLRAKPVGIIGASTGNFGTMRAQTALRTSLLFPGCNVMPAPELMVFRCSERFDSQGNLTDETTRRLVGECLQALVVWVGSFRRQAATRGR